jgi:transposase
MSIRPRLGVEVPELTARVARASNPAGTTAMWVRDRLDGLWDDEDFAGWYPRDGRPGISPAQLATVSVLQFLLDLSDRDAAEAVRCRIDFKYALGLDLDDPGFHHSVLGDFRDRLLADGRADRLLDLALARLKEAGLVRERTAQRTDSTHVLAAVRDLTRLELVTEAVRAALEELARTAGHALEGLVDDDWGRRYGRPVRLGKNPTRPKTRMNGTGTDARLLLKHLAASFPGLLRGPRVEALRQVLAQNYHWDGVCQIFCARGFSLSGSGCLSLTVLSRYLMSCCPVYSAVPRNRTFRAVPGLMLRVPVFPASCAAAGACCLILRGSHGGPSRLSLNIADGNGAGGVTRACPFPLFISQGACGRCRVPGGCPVRCAGCRCAR